MNLSGKDYLNLYKLQDKVFGALSGNYGPLYLTGRTALGRFYLNHRYSDDIDLFTNSDNSFKDVVTKIRFKLDATFNTLTDKLILYDEFIRVWVEDNNCQLKIEFVNDVPYRWGEIEFANTIPIDSLGNILSNKLTALVSRDEPKDVFDIVHIALNYSFKWDEVFEHSVKKAIVSEQDVAMRLESFPVEYLLTQPWLMGVVKTDEIKSNIKTIADDFLFANDNSLGIGKTPIAEAKPIAKE